MSAELLERARAGDRDAFAALVEPHRAELQVHCYRMLGSLQDAEDALQETLLSAWLGLDGFEGRSSVRTWLYRIATNRCLNVLRSSGRRPVTAAPLPIAPPEPTRMGEVLWLQPYPDVLLDGLRMCCPIRRRARRPGTSPARRSRSRSSPPSSCCRRTSGPCCCCAMCSATAPVRPPGCSASPRTPSPARSAAPGRRWTPPARPVRRRHRPADRRSARWSTGSSPPLPTWTSTRSSP